MIEAEVGKWLIMVCCAVLLPACTSDVVSYRLPRPLGWLCNSSGVSAPASASARVRSLQRSAYSCQVSSRASLHGSSGFWAIGLTEFLVAFRMVGLVEARGVSVALCT
jgi:hypothetical protein